MQRSEEDVAAREILPFEEESHSFWGCFREASTEPNLPVMAAADQLIKPICVVCFDVSLRCFKPKHGRFTSDRSDRNHLEKQTRGKPSKCLTRAVLFPKPGAVGRSCVYRTLPHLS